MSKRDQDIEPWPSEVTITVDALAHGGAALGRHESGRVVFVDGGIPGETLRARIDQGHPRYAHATLDELPSEPSADRVLSPRCDHAGIWPDRGIERSRYCGGCTLSHMTYEAQLRHKAAVVADTLGRIGRIDDPPVRQALGMSEPWGYRNRIDMHVGEDGLGFVAADGARVVPIETCHIAHPDLVDMTHAFEPGLPSGSGVVLRVGVETGDRMIVLFGMDEHFDFVDDIEVTLDASVALLRDNGMVEAVAGRRFLFERVAGHLFAIPPASFFQVNTEMAHVLVKLVRDAVPQDSSMVVDAYAGVGLFTVTLADQVAEMISIEGDPDAVQAALMNTEGRDNVTILEADVTEGLSHVTDCPDVVVVDPPRTGLARDVVRLLADARPPRIVYVSCEPSTLARDAMQLVASGWRLQETHVVDMFPHTHHIESVNVFDL